MKRESMKVPWKLSLEKKCDPALQTALHQNRWYLTCYYTLPLPGSQGPGSGVSGPDFRLYPFEYAFFFCMKQSYFQYKLRKIIIASASKEGTDFALWTLWECKVTPCTPYESL